MLNSKVNIIPLTAMGNILLKLSISTIIQETSMRKVFYGIAFPAIVLCDYVEINRDVTLYYSDDPIP